MLGEEDTAEPTEPPSSSVSQQRSSVRVRETTTNTVSQPGIYNRLVTSMSTQTMDDELELSEQRDTVGRVDSKSALHGIVRIVPSVKWTSQSTVITDSSAGSRSSSVSNLNDPGVMFTLGGKRNTSHQSLASSENHDDQVCLQF